MPTVRISLIDRPRHPYCEDGSIMSAEESQESTRQTFSTELGIEEDNLVKTTDKVDPEIIQRLNEEFLHSSVALNALHESINSARKQQSAAYNGDKILPGASDRLEHANRELGLAAQDIALSRPM